MAQENVKSLGQSPAEATGQSFLERLKQFKSHAEERWKELKESQNMDEFFDEELEDLLGTELVTIVSRQAQPIDEVPNIITVITQEEIRQSGARTLGEALNLVPGINLRYGAPLDPKDTVNAENFIMRGSVFGGTRHILFLLDGQRLNTPQNGGIANTLPVIPLHNVVRIELIRGLGSARYGTGAVTGVVNIITKRGNDLRGGEISTSVHNHRGFAHSLLIGDKLGPWVLSFNGLYSDDDGEQFRVDKLLGGKKRVSDGRELKNLALNLQYDEFFFKFHHYEHKTDPFVTFGRANAEDDPLANGKGTTTLFSLGYEWLYSSGSLLFDVQHARFTSRFSGLFLESIRRESDTSALNEEELANFYHMFDGENDPFYLGQVADDIRLSTNLQWLHRIGNDHVVEAGITSIKETLVDSATLDNLTYDRTGKLMILTDEKDLNKKTLTRNEDRYIHSLYLQENWRMSHQMSVYLGGRYDDYSDFGTTFNPRLGMVYRISDQQIFKMLYGTAFRAPSFQEQFGSVDNFGAAVENNLDPETSQWSEIAYQYGISRIYKLKFNVYQGIYEDFIISNNFVPDEVEEPNTTKGNFLDIMTRGVESEVRVDFRPQHYAIVNVNRGAVRFNIKGIKKDFFNVLLPQTMWNAIYNYPVKEWLNTNASISYRSERLLDLEGHDTMPAYTKINFHLIVRPPQFPTLEGFVGGRNITDVETESPIILFNDIPARGREFVGGIRVDF